MSIEDSFFLWYTVPMDGKTTFRVDQKIVYPSQGVGKIVEIKEKLFKNEPVLYYVIYIAVSDMTIMAPVDKAEELGIRAIVSADEANAALELISQDFEQISSDWKLRYQTNLDLLKKGSISDIATIVRSLYHRSKIKELPILERKLYDSARKLLEDEISYALDISKEEAESRIHSHLEPFGEYNQTCIGILREEGFVYGRTCANTDRVLPCGEPLVAATSMHWLNPDFALRLEKARESGVFYFWGHSYEMKDDPRLRERYESIIRDISADPEARWVDVVDLVTE